MVRRSESAYKELCLSNMSLEDELIAAVSATPVLIERPIAISGDAAVIGGPPDSVFAPLS